MKNEFEKRFLSSIILVPLSFFFIIKGSFLFNFFLAVCFIVTSYEWHMMSKKKNYLIPGYLFLIFTFYCTYNLRNHFGNESLSYFLLIIIICISTDIGGYFFGKTFKGPKLTKISPNKTYSGMFGGFILSVILATIYFNNLSDLSLAESNTDIGIQIMLIVLSISFISQVGDLVISFFKRKSKIKNTGKIIPGHGGLLDRIDGMIFAFPYTFILMKII